jgi:hypothetical protein
MDVGAIRVDGECIDDVPRRTDLGIAATKVDEWRSALRSGRGDATEQCDEVLLGQALETCRSGPHWEPL